VGKAMSSNESAAYEIMRMLDVDYVLVIFGGVIGYSGDDINKFLWMVRIAEGEHPKDIRVSCLTHVCYLSTMVHLWFCYCFTPTDTKAY
jgi:asparagine N-glycosylation enzyme membrane subunit Stt3